MSRVFQNVRCRCARALAMAVALLLFPGLSAPPAGPHPILEAAAANPTVEAYVALREGEYYERNGDYQSALARYQAATSVSPQSADGREAYLRLARLHYHTGEYEAAAETLRDFLDRYPDDSPSPTALYLLGVDLRALGKLPEAAEYFSRYVAANGLLGAYAHLQLGEIHLGLDEPPAAAEHYARALDFHLPQAVAAGAMDSLATMYARLGDHPAAEAWRQRQLAGANSGARRADVLAGLAETRRAQGRGAEARGLLLEIIHDYSWTSSAVGALGSIAAEGGAVDAFQEGLVHFRNDRYEAAAGAFDRYLAANPSPQDAARAIYYKALSRRYQGRHQAAVATLHEMLAVNSASSLAGEAMWQLGWLNELDGNYWTAIHWYGRSAADHPRGDLATDALFRKGLNLYRLDDLASARAAWEEYLGRYADSPSRPRVQFWLGKLLLEMGETEAAAAHLSSVAELQGQDYYGVRAREYYEARVVGSAAGYALDTATLNNDRPWEQLGFEAWLAAWAPPGVTFDGSYAALSGDEGFARARELTRLGLVREARGEIDELRERYRGDSVALYELLMFLRDNELYRLSVLTANDILRFSPAATVNSIPLFLQKMIYPIPFAELILGEVRNNGIDPLLFTALIRQESMFDQRAESPARARGLGQVMPETGGAIAQAMALGSFEADELFKPYISLAFGAYYLANNLSEFEGNPFFALAAYNAGPGNVERWLAGNPRRDVDLFVEDIGYSETQTYVRRVYFFYDMYRQIWAEKI